MDATLTSSTTRRKPPAPGRAARRAGVPAPPPTPPLAPALPDLLRRFSFNGAPTVETEQDGLNYFVNEFWTAQQRQAHALHEVSYRACFKPQLPEFFISRLTDPGGRVHDPFSGRGTTALQAALMGRAAAANDVNPLSAMLLAPRLAPPPIEAVQARLAALKLTSRAAGPRDLLAFYHPRTLRQIVALRSYLLARAESGLLDDVDSWIRMVAINRLTGHSSGFFSVYTMPPNQAVSAESQRRINAKRGQTPPERDVAAIIARKTASLLRHGTPPALPALPALLTGAADATSALAPSSIDLLVTSPPFLDVVDYAGDNWLRCWFAGIDPRSVRINQHRDIASWEGFVRRCFGEFARILRPGAHVAFEVGEVRRGGVRLEQHVVRAIEGLPFSLLGVMVNEQNFTRTANCWGVANNTDGTNTNRIVLARRL